MEIHLSELGSNSPRFLQWTSVSLKQDISLGIEPSAVIATTFLRTRRHKVITPCVVLYAQKKDQCFCIYRVQSRSCLKENMVNPTGKVAEMDTLLSYYWDKLHTVELSIYYDWYIRLYKPLWYISRALIQYDGATSRYGCVIASHPKSSTFRSSFRTCLY